MNLHELEKLADHIASARLYGITNPSVAVCLGLTAIALGFDPVQGLAGLRLIDGKPSPSADMLVAACIRNPQCERFVETVSTDQVSTWETVRNGVKSVETFSMADAQLAKLVKPNSPWEKYPRKMLSARAKAALARRVYPDVCFGYYTPDELGSEPPPPPREVRGVLEPPAVVAIPQLPAPPGPQEALRAIANATSEQDAKALARAAIEAGAGKDEVLAAYTAVIGGL